MRLVGHLAWIAVMMAAWVFMAATTEGFGWDVVIALASFHVGVVAYKTWPTN